VLSHRHSDLDKPEPVPFGSNLAQPMRRALSGQSGTVIGPDYRDVTVLAAHEPVAVLDLFTLRILSNRPVGRARSCGVHPGGENQVIRAASGGYLYPEPSIRFHLEKPVGAPILQ
jgi:hypothetical protein